MKSSLNKRGIESLVGQVIIDNKGRLSTELASSLSSGKIKPLPTAKILRTLVSVGGTQSLVDSNTKKIDGQSDFDGNRLDPNTVLVIPELAVRYGKDAATGKETSLLYNQTFPASFRNAILRIKQGGVVLTYMPFSELIAPSGITNREDQYAELDLPLVLVGGPEFEFEVIFPSGAVADTNEYLEFVFKGYETKRSVTA